MARDGGRTADTQIFRICASELNGVSELRSSDSRKLGYPSGLQPATAGVKSHSCVGIPERRELQKRQKTSVCTQICTQNALQRRYIVHPLDAVLVKCPYLQAKMWSRRRDLNPRPDDYKSTALPTELHRLMAGCRGKRQTMILANEIFRRKLTAVWRQL